MVWGVAGCDLAVKHALLPLAGYTDMELVVDCSEAALLVQPQNSPPVIDRLFDYSIDTAGPIESFRCATLPARTGRTYTFSALV